MYAKRCTHRFFILFSNLEQTDTDPAADFGAKCSFTKSGQRDCDSQHNCAEFLLEECSLEETNILKITHETIAGHMGTAREVVTRMLRYFQNEGMVKLARGTVEICEERRLQELSIAIFKNKANSRRNGTSLSSQKAKLSEKHIVSRSEEHPGSVP